jgi:6-phosphogluconate dehydrogenase
MESKGFSVAVFNRTTEVTEKFAAGRAHGENIRPTLTLEEFVGALKKPRIAMMMVKAGPPVDSVIGQLAPLLEKGDVIIDGGNSLFTDTQRRERELQSTGIHFVGMGVSGGEEGALKGPSLMPGGSRESWEIIAPIFRKIAAQVDGEPCCRYMGPGGAGHYVKMVHNGIEYGLMQAYAEGFEILKEAHSQSLPEAERLDLDLADIAEVWRRGSVISSWLLDLTASALAGDSKLDAYSGFVEDSGEGRWTIQAAIAEAVPAEVLSAALYARFRSRREHTFAEKVLSAMRKGFGGHIEPRAVEPKAIEPSAVGPRTDG